MEASEVEAPRLPTAGTRCPETPDRLLALEFDDDHIYGLRVRRGVVNSFPIFPARTASRM
jgi:hypothetical protein